MFDGQILIRSSSIYLTTKQCDKGSATQIYWSNMYQKFSTWLKLVNFCGQNQIVLKLFMVVSILGTYFTLSNQETTLNCINTMVHWKAFTEFCNWESSLSCDENISMFGSILIHSSSWPATAEPVTNASFSFLSSKPYPYCAYIKCSFP